MKISSKSSDLSALTSDAGKLVLVVFFATFLSRNIFTAFRMSLLRKHQVASVKNIVVSGANAWRASDTPCFFLFPPRLHRPQDAPRRKSKELAINKFYCIMIDLCGKNGIMSIFF